MGAHVAETVVKLMLQSGIGVCNSRVLILGLAFEENCPDLRNTREVDIIYPLGALCWPEGEDLAPESLARYRSQ